MAGGAAVSWHVQTGTMVNPTLQVTGGGAIDWGRGAYDQLLLSTSALALMTDCQ